MFDNMVEETEYIQDCSKYQLAVKVGFFGILLSLIASIAWQVVWFIYYMPGDIHDFSVLQVAAILNPISFTGALFTSVGFVGVFAMKRSRLGIIFPLLIFTSQISWNLVFYMAYDLHFFTSELLSSVNNFLAISFAIIGCLALFTIRRVSANPFFLTVYAFYYVAKIGLSFLVNPVIVFLFFDGLTYFTYQLPTFVLNLIGTVLLIHFFSIESRMGCIDALDNQADIVV